MYTNRFWLCCVMTLVSSLGVLMAFPAGAVDDLKTAKEAFAAPAGDYTTAPFWVWNDAMTDDQLLFTLQSLASQGIRQIFVHPRPGLMTPYLSEEWFRLWKVAMAEAEKLDVDLWIYDENSYPSGFAGGWVPEKMPESRGKGLAIRAAKKLGPIDDAVLAVFSKVDGAYTNVTAEAKAGTAMPEGDYLVARINLSNASPWFGGKTYVDLLHPGVTEKFLELTLDPYIPVLGDEFGKRMPGSFTDEPHLAPAGGQHWTDDLEAVFQQRWGYSLVESLPSLVEPVGDWKRVRHNYYQVLLDLFIDRWAKPYFDYCAKHNLEFTGHYWEHSWPETGSAPDNMAMEAWQQRPGIDILFNQYDEGPHAQFGNVRAVIELGSAANQMGWKRTLCETYGGSGWDVRFEDLKRIGDWVSVLGVNMINEHLSHSTLRGARKGDYPITFSYHTPWWGEYHVLESYFTRVTYATTRGEQINPILVLEPTTTAWMYQGDCGEDKLGPLGNGFQKLVTDLAKAQVEFDLGCESIIANNGSVKGPAFVVGKRSYSTVVIPREMENINAKTRDLLTEYLKAGGRVVVADESRLAFVDGQSADVTGAFSTASGWTVQPLDGMGAYLQGLSKGGFSIVRAEGDAGILYHQRRQLDDGDLVYLVNTSIDAPAKGTVLTPMKGVESWDLETGAVKAYPFTTADGMTQASFELAPCGSLLLCLTKAVKAPGAVVEETRTALEAATPVTVQRDSANVLTLDYVDVTAGGETKTGMLCTRAAEFVFSKNGAGRNPWNHSVQFSDELLKMPFAADSGFTLTYRFVVEGSVPASLYFVAERPDLYEITCNDTPLKPSGEWWCDRAFGKMDVAKIAVAGENVVTMKASPMTVFHEVAPAYVVGDFGLSAAEKGFAITEAAPLAVGSWKAQGLPLYGAGVTYTASYKVADGGAGRFEVSLPSWYGSVANVTVNGKPIGHIYCQPMRCDVSQAMVSGDNVVAVTVFGTMKNTMGPHHENPPLGIASPDMFMKGPEQGPPAGSAYSTIDYGLLAPFVVEQVK